MNPALQAAIAASAKQHKQLLDQLKERAAFSRETAIKQADLGSEQTALVAHYLKRGIIRSTPDGGIYLDRRAFEDHLSSQKTAGKWVLLIVGLSSLVGLLLLLANKL
jgi:hypothetical protein